MATRKGVREPAVAGVFYPDDPGALRDSVAGHLHRAEHNHLSHHAIIAPHAGYAYSGPIAGTAFSSVKPDAYRRAIIIGPSHRFSFDGIAVPSAESFVIPGGEVPVDPITHTLAGEIDGVVTEDRAHDREHSIEVELPFLTARTGSIPIIPLVTGNVRPVQVAALLEALWTTGTLLVVSSDLSHFLDYNTAKKVDAESSELIERGDGESLTSIRACGHIAITALLQVLERRGLWMKTLDLRNSGDTAGTRESVVGYGAYAAI